MRGPNVYPNGWERGEANYKSEELSEDEGGGGRVFQKIDKCSQRRGRPGVAEGGMRVFFEDFRGGRGPSGGENAVG